MRIRNLGWCLAFLVAVTHAHIAAGDDTADFESVLEEARAGANGEQAAGQRLAFEFLDPDQAEEFRTGAQSLPSAAERALEVLEGLSSNPNACAAPGRFQANSFQGEFCRGRCPHLPCGSITVKTVKISNYTRDFQSGSDGSDCSLWFRVADWDTIVEKTALGIAKAIGKRNIDCFSPQSAPKPCVCKNKVKNEITQTLTARHVPFNETGYPKCRFWIQGDYTFTIASEVGRCAASTGP